MKARTLARALLALALVAPACAKTTLPGGSVGKKNAAPPTAPLTGLVVANAINRPALAVKVENAKEARPQSGLEHADIVYEELVEGGITRFIAIFQSRDTAKLGPVRSARLVDPDILAEYGTALFAYSGGAGQVLRAVKGADLVPFDETTSKGALKRIGPRRAPHNLYGNTKSLYAVAKGRGGRPPVAFNFGELPPAPTPTAAPRATATPAPAWPAGAAVRVPFSDNYVSTWRYHATEGTYVRFQGAVAHRMTSGEQLSAKNVLLVYVKVKEGTHLDAAGNPSYDIAVVGEGKAVLLRDGVRVAGTWSRASIGARTTYSDLAGRPFVFAPGQTWVEMVPVGTAVSFPKALASPGR